MIGMDRNHFLFRYLDPITSQVVPEPIMLSITGVALHSRLVRNATIFLFYCCAKSTDTTSTCVN